jgi:thiamine pyrophosphokinase
MDKLQLSKTELKNIEFGSNNFDCIVCLKADLPGKEFFEQFSIPVLAADGAALRLLDKSIVCDYIIGDLDSFREPPRNIFEDERIIYEPDQESNDFEKIFRFCEIKGFKNLLITGLHGGALEHTLNNWSVLMRYGRNFNTCLYDKGRYGLPVYGTVRMKSRKDEIISIIPVNTTKIKTAGLAWPLQDEYLVFGKREGARNKCTADEFEIHLAEGEFILFFDARLPYAPNFISE